MFLENISMDFTTEIMNSFLVDGIYIMRNNGYIDGYFNKLCSQKYKEESADSIKHDFCISLGLYHFFVENKATNYHLSAIHLLKVLPYQFGRFIEDIYAMRLSYFPICIDISTLILQEEMQDILDKYNKGMIVKMQQYLDQLEKSNDIKCHKLYCQYKLIADEIYEIYNKQMKEGNTIV